MQEKQQQNQKTPPRRGLLHALLRRLLVIVGGVYVGMALIAVFARDTLIFYPTSEIPNTPSDIGLEYEQVELVTEDGLRLSAWYVPGEGKKYMVFCHGNAGNISHRLDSLALFHHLGLNCLIFDYRGYGHSEGRPSEEGTYKDAMAAYRWLREHKGAEADDIIIFGRSLGGAVAAWLAAHVECGGLVVESSFTSVVDMAGRLFRFLPARLLVRQGYENSRWIAKAGCPVLVVHSREDELIPFDMGKELFEAAAEPKSFLEIEGDHNEGFLVTGIPYMEGLQQWLETLDE